MTRTTTLAVAADYADALMTARRAKNWLFLLLLLLLLLQIAVFFLLRFGILRLSDVAGVSPAPVIAHSVPATGPASTEDTTLADYTTPPTTTDSAVTTSSSTPAPQNTRGVEVRQFLRYALPIIDFLGLIAVIVFTIVLLLLTTIMLVGRLVGVSSVTSAFVWSVVLTVLLFPWQCLFIRSDYYPTVDRAGLVADTVDPQPSFKVPGVLYTYAELVHDYRFESKFDKAHLAPTILKWGRFAGFPALAIILLMMVQGKSSRGLRLALGEADIQVDVTTRPGDSL